VHLSDILPAILSGKTSVILFCLETDNPGEVVCPLPLGLKSNTKLHNESQPFSELFSFSRVCHIGFSVTDARRTLTGLRFLWMSAVVRRVRLEADRGRRRAAGRRRDPPAPRVVQAQPVRLEAHRPRSRGARRRSTRNLVPNSNKKRRWRAKSRG